MRRTRILFFDPHKKNRRDAIRIMGATGCEVIAPESFKKLEEIILEQEFTAYALDIEGHQHLTSKGINISRVPTIVLSQQSLGEVHPYLADLRYFTNFIAKGPHNVLQNGDLLGTVAKIVYNDIFGIKKYLAWGAHTQTFHLRDSHSRRDYVQHIKHWAESLGLRSAIVKQVEIVTEELLMNAIYDAPVDEKGQRVHNHKTRTERVVLSVMHAARLEFGSDGRRVAISVTDPFGSITRDLVLKALMRCFSQRDINHLGESGGAGLGLYFCYKHVDSLVINLDPMQKTEFIGLIDIESTVKESKLAGSHTALHFFNTDNFSPLFLQPHSPQRKKASA